MPKWFNVLWWLDLLEDLTYLIVGILIVVGVLSLIVLPVIYLWIMLLR